MANQTRITNENKLHFVSWLVVTFIGVFLGITLPITISIFTQAKNNFYSFEVGLLVGGIFEIVTLIGINFLDKSTWYIPVSWLWVIVAIFDVSTLAAIDLISSAVGFLLGYALIFIVGIFYINITAIYYWFFGSYLHQFTILVSSIFIVLTIWLFVIFNDSYSENKHILISLFILGAINLSGSLFTINSGSAIAVSICLSAIALSIVFAIKFFFNELLASVLVIFPESNLLSFHFLSILGSIG